MRRRCFVLAPAVALLVAGCVGFSRPALETTRFLLQLEPPAAGARTAGTLTLAPVRVSSLYDRQGFVYRTGESTFTSDPRHEWFAPPAGVLREAILDWLARAGPFASVQRGSVSGAEWLLETGVDRFYADLREREAPAVVLEGRFRLLDLRSPGMRLVLAVDFEEREPAGAGTPQELVDAWARALARALAALEPQLRAATASPPPVARR
jgi:uncharacterized lipoprotein YmbA